MDLRIVLAAGAAVALTTPSFAETGSGATKVAPIETTAEVKALIGAPLDPSASGATAEPDGDTGPLFVISGNNMKPVGEWSAADSQACKAAGGVELEISAGRIACINL